MRKLAFAGTAIMLAVAHSSPSVAQVADRDSCLVGTWTPTNNGAAEWIERNIPGMNIDTTISDGSFVLESDGSYWANANIFASANPAAGASARSEVSARAEGYWSTPAGRLVLAPTLEVLEGAIEFTTEGGTYSSPVEAGDAMVQNYAYACSGETLETELVIPGVDDPMIHQYRKVSG